MEKIVSEAAWGPKEHRSSNGGVAAIPKQRSITSPEDHVHVLHGGGKGGVALAQRFANRWVERMVPIEGLADTVRNLAGEADVFLSQNRFHGDRRAVARLLQLDALYADLDHYKTAFGSLTPRQLLPVVLGALDEANVPAPSYAVATGRGLAVTWLHTPVPRQALPRWRLCQQSIYETLKPFGADPQATDAARVLRLIGTHNPKSRSMVEALTDAGETWVFDDLANEILPLKRADLKALLVERAKRQSVKDNRAQIPTPANYTAATLWEGRLTEMQRWLHHRYGGELPRGRRDAWLFIASVAISHLAPVDVMRREVFALAEEVGRWSEGETRSRLSAVISRAERAARGERIEWRGRMVDPRYRFRTETIIEWLDITQTEMLSLNFRHLVTPEIKREHDRTRKEQARRAAGAVPRPEYEANSAARQKPWEGEGISRAQWYRRRRNASGTNTSRTDETGASGCMVAKPVPGRLVGPSGAINDISPSALPWPAGRQDASIVSSSPQTGGAGLVAGDHRGDLDAA